MLAPIEVVQDFVPEPMRVFETLRDELAWVRHDGAARCEYYCNDFDRPYTYGQGRGRRTYEKQPWHPAILAMRNALELRTGRVFETCFLNRYLTKRDGIGWHSDDSPEMDDARPIGVISLGAEREIWFKPKFDKAPVEGLKLLNGSLVLMKPGMQDTHSHRIPKASWECGERISLTFRGYVVPES